MTIERTEVLWLEARGGYTLHELIEMSGLPQSVIDELIECGALPAEDAVPQPTQPSTFRFAAESVVLARAARRLREHFELEHQGLAVAVSLLRRVRTLEAQLAEAGFAKR